MTRRYNVTVRPGVVNFKSAVVQSRRSSNLVVVLDHRNLVQGARSAYKLEIGPINGADGGEWANPCYLARVSPLSAQGGVIGRFHDPFHGAACPVIRLLDGELLTVRIVLDDDPVIAIVKQADRYSHGISRAHAYRYRCGGGWQDFPPCPEPEFVGRTGACLGIGHALADASLDQVGVSGQVGRVLAVYAHPFTNCLVTGGIAGELGDGKSSLDDREWSPGKRVPRPVGALLAVVADIAARCGRCGRAGGTVVVGAGGTVVVGGGAFELGRHANVEVAGELALASVGHQGKGDGPVHPGAIGTDANVRREHVPARPQVGGVDNVESLLAQEMKLARLGVLDPGAYSRGAAVGPSCWGAAPTDRMAGAGNGARSK